ncbi:hypothetical protein L1987_88979 [Smallanthus sonchifolius]|nr:hypothetical protein L1987_88979 [Smallanthus sonchifolius]
MAALAAPPSAPGDPPVPRASFASILAGTSSSSPAVTKAPVKPILPDILLLNNPLLSMVLPFSPIEISKASGSFNTTPHCKVIEWTALLKALAKKTPRLPPASTAVAPKLPLKQATSTSLNPPKAQDKPPQTTWRQRSRNKEKKVVEFEHKEIA